MCRSYPSQLVVQSSSIAVIALLFQVSAAHADPPLFNELAVTVTPSSLTDQDTFDLRAFHTFGDTGYTRLDQTVSVSGNQIDVYVLIQDLHTMPNSVFPQVITPAGAFFDDYGPLAAGTYQVNAEMWYTAWPTTEPSIFFDMGSLTFEVTSAVPEPTTVGMMLVAAGLFAIGKRRTVVS
jgi:hypothetical protein